MDGADVNEPMHAEPGGTGVLPLAAALCGRSLDFVKLLLRHGADPDGHEVMLGCAWFCPRDVLELMLDAGGDINDLGDGVPLLCAAIGGGREDNVRLLLAHPLLELDQPLRGSSFEAHAVEKGKPAMAELIRAEVRGSYLKQPQSCHGCRRIDAAPLPWPALTPLLPGPPLVLDAGPLPMALAMASALAHC